MTERLWFYGISGKPQGPVSEPVLRDKFRNGELEPETLVWTQGMAQWVAAKSLSEFADCLQRPQSFPLEDLSGSPGPVSQSAESVSGAAVRGTEETQGSWYITHAGRVCGPFPDHVLREMIRSGLISAETAVMREGENKWVPLGKVPHFESLTSAGGRSVPAFTSPSSTFGSASASGGTPSPTFGTLSGWQGASGQSGWANEAGPWAASRQGRAQRKEQVFTYAGFFERFFARLIDAIVLFVVGLPFLILGPFGGWLVHFLYTTLLNASSWQGTVGKKLLGLKVSDLEGRRISFGVAVLRYFAEAVVGVGLWVLAAILSACLMASAGASLDGVDSQSPEASATVFLTLILLVPIAIVPFINYLRVAWTPRKQTWYDQWVGTIVTRG